MTLEVDMTPEQRQEHRRLVARLRRQVAKAERHGGPARLDKITRTVRELVELEESIQNPLRPLPVTIEDIEERLALMSRGAGLTVIERG